MHRGQSPRLSHCPIGPQLGYKECESYAHRSLLPPAYFYSIQDFEYLTTLLSTIDV